MFQCSDWLGGMMRHLDLFSGIGGFALAASMIWPYHEVVTFCEIEKKIHPILKRHFPGVPIVEDIRDLKGDNYANITLLTGGFPCQPFSHAGKRKGKEDNRFLWPEMLRIIREAEPEWVIGENVSGILSIDGGMVIEQVLSDLENAGYETLPPLTIPACAVDAPHRRDRVWIVAHSNVARERRNQRQSEAEKNVAATNANSPGLQETGAEQQATGVEQHGKLGRNVANTNGTRPQRERKERKTPGSPGLCCGERGNQNKVFPNAEHNGSCRAESNEAEPSSNRQKNRIFERNHTWPTEPRICRVVNGLPNRVDRIKGLGNAIVPQVAMRIMAAIKATD